MITGRVALVTILVSIQAAAYEPVECESAKEYAGAPLHPPIDLTRGFSGSLDGTFDDPTARRFAIALDEAMSSTAALSMTAAVAVPGVGIWTSERADQDITLSADMHYWASAGKTLTALAVLMLVEESKLALTDPISKYVDGVPNGGAITVEMLLNHTNGLFSVNEDRKVRRRKNELTFDESLAIMRKHGAMFCPGERWRYTNSGYSLLGRILEVVEGRPFDQVISASVVKPLKLPNIRVLSSGDTSQDVATLHTSDPKVDPMRPGSAGAAGPMVASSEAVVRMWHAVLNSKVIHPDTLSLMFQRLYPMFSGSTYYGLGVMAYEVPQPDGTKNLWLGHSGGAPGVQAMFAYSPSDHAFVAVALSGGGSAEATAYSLLSALAD